MFTTVVLSPFLDMGRVRGEWIYNTVIKVVCLFLLTPNRITWMEHILVGIGK